MEQTLTTDDNNPNSVTSYLELAVATAAMKASTEEPRPPVQRMASSSPSKSSSTESEGTLQDGSESPKDSLQAPSPDVPASENPIAQSQTSGMSITPVRLLVAHPRTALPSAAGSTTTAPANHYSIKSPDETLRLIQQSADCFERAGLGIFPATGTVEGERDTNAWLPYVTAMGLKQGVYPRIHVEGKRPQTGRSYEGRKDKNGNVKAADWNYLIYTVLAVAPGGALASKTAYHICLAWCPELKAINATLRHNLTVREEFFNFTDDKDQKLWRLTNEGEVQIKNDPKKGVSHKRSIKRETSSSPNGNPAPKTQPEVAAQGQKCKQLIFAPEDEDDDDDDPSDRTIQDISSPQTSSRPQRKRRPPKWMDEDNQLESSHKEIQDNGGPGPQTTTSRNKKAKTVTPNQDNGNSGAQTETSRKCKRAAPKPKSGKNTRKTQDGNEEEADQTSSQARHRTYKLDYDTYNFARKPLRNIWSRGFYRVLPEECREGDKLGCFDRVYTWPPYWWGGNKTLHDHDDTGIRTPPPGSKEWQARQELVKYMEKWLTECDEQGEL